MCLTVILKRIKSLFLKYRYYNKPAPLPRSEQNEENRWLVIDYSGHIKTPFNGKIPWYKLRDIGVVMQLNDYNDIHNTTFSIDDVYGVGHYELIEKERIWRIEHPKINPLFSVKDIYKGYDINPSDFDPKYTNELGLEGIRFHYYLTHLDTHNNVDQDIKIMMSELAISEPIKLYLAKRSKGLDNSVSSLYIKNFDPKWPRDSDIVNYVRCTPSKRSAWQIYLLAKSGLVLPMSGLGIWSNHCKYILSLENIKNLNIFKGLDLDSELAKMLLPKVTLVDNVATIYCYFWNERIGLTQEIYEVKFGIDKIDSVNTKHHHVSNKDSDVEDLLIHSMLGKSVRVNRQFNIGYLIFYRAPYTGGGEIPVYSGEIFTNLSTMRDDAFYAKCLNDKMYLAAAQKAISEETHEDLKHRLGGISFFITVDQIRNYCTFVDA